MKPNDMHHVETGLQTLEEHGQMLKAHLLEAGAQGHLPVPEMDARLRSASATRRALQQAVKAMRLLNDATSENGLEQPSAPEEQPQP